MDEGSDFLAVQHLLQVAYDVHIEDVDGQVVLGSLQFLSLVTAMASSITRNRATA